MAETVFLTAGVGILDQLIHKFTAFLPNVLAMDGLIVYLLVHLLITSCAYLCTANVKLKILRVGVYEDSLWKRFVCYFAEPKRRMAALFGIAYAAYVTVAVFRKIDAGVGGVDAFDYKRLFAFATCSFAEYQALCQQELLYLGFVWLLRRVFTDFRIVLWVVHSAALVCFFYYAVNRPSKKGGVVDFLCLFLTFGFLFNMFNLLRSILAMSFVLVFLVQMEKERYKTAPLWLLIAMGIHTAAVIMVPVYFAVVFLKKIRTERIWQLLLWIVAGLLFEAVVMKFAAPIISASGKYSFYGNSQGISIGTYMIVLAMTAAIWLRDRAVCRTAGVQIGCWIVCLAWMCLPIQSYFSIAYRMVILFMPVIYQMIPPVLEAYRKKTLLNFGVKFVLLAYVCLRLYLLYVAEFTADGLYPYVMQLAGDGV